MTLTGPHGLFTIEQQTNHYTVERDATGRRHYRDCVVMCADGVRRLYGIDVETLDAL